jgi:ABC-type nitrate/sulfonate/bicarbonate transport system ATPase subunit
MIEINNGALSLSRDGQRNLSISIHLSNDDFAVLLGRNGSGKTTALDTIAGVRQLDAGTLSIQPSNAAIGYVVQDSSSGLLPWRTILSNILLPSKLRAGSHDAMNEKALNLLSSFGLLDRKDDFPYRLSEGEKQIVNLIRAACTPANILLLDEPFASLNAKARSISKDVLEKFASGRTTVFVTHDPFDLDLPITRWLLITDSTLAEVNKETAKEFLENVATKPTN